MPPLITDPIPVQNFELIRVRIGEILTAELLEQSVLTGESIFNAQVWEERFTPFGNDEMPPVNVSFVNAQSNDYTQISDRYNYTYYIDVHVKAKATSTEYGDKKSQQDLQRLSGVIRRILRDTHYKTLAFSPGFITKSNIDSIQIQNPYDGDGNFIGMARINFMVLASETNGTERANPTSGYDTEVRLEETEKGYKFTLNNT